MSAISLTNVQNIATAVAELMKRAGAETNHIDPIDVKVTIGHPSAGIPWSVNFTKGEGVVLGNSRREAYNALQAMHYALRFTLGL